MKIKGPESLLAQVGETKHPPVWGWHPELSGDIDIRIARNGTWFHEGSPIERDRLVKLFASILRREGDEYFLVTPVEKWRIQVDDAPFVVTYLSIVGEGKSQQLLMSTNVDDKIVVDREHAIHVKTDPQTEEPSPSVHVRDQLYALINRNVYYELVASAREEKGQIGIDSCGIFFPMGSAE
ncbi:MAG: DUF1285 domain-containing protein [Gammaproteobacteria bacterium]|nr:DUF1285 domain-containing protein [Gammaproteobacteria bacterium]